MTVSLREILESRDRRQARQHALIEEYKLPIVSLTLVMPGNVKRNELTRQMACEATRAIRKQFAEALLASREDDLPTGFEALYVVTLEREAAKKRACAIEDTHPWGRLFDIDVMGEDRIPLSRQAVGAAPRRCLLCDNEAHYCMKNRTHQTWEIIQRIEEIINKQP